MSDCNEILVIVERATSDVEELLRCVKGTGLETEESAISEALATLKRVGRQAQAGEEAANMMMSGTPGPVVMGRPLSLRKGKRGA